MNKLALGWAGFPPFHAVKVCFLKAWKTIAILSCHDCDVQRKQVNPYSTHVHLPPFISWLLSVGVYSTSVAGCHLSHVLASFTSEWKTVTEITFFEPLPNKKFSKVELAFI